MLCTANTHFYAKAALTELYMHTFNLHAYLRLPVNSGDFNKSSMKHIPHTSCMLLESCLYVLSMNMFVLPAYLYAQGHYCRKRKALLL